MSKISEAFKDTKAFIPFIYGRRSFPGDHGTAFIRHGRGGEQTLLRSGSLFQILLQKVL